MEAKKEINRTGIVNAFSLAILQAIITVCSFTANYFVARHMKKADYGFGNVNMSFLITLVNFFLKDALRKNIQKDFAIEPNKEKVLVSSNNASIELLKKRSAINLGWIGVCWTVGISLSLIAYLHHYFASMPGHSSSEASASYIYAGCCIIEAVSEPLNFKYMMENDFKNRVRSESTGNICRTFVLAYLAYLNFGVYAFAYVQLAYVLTATTK